MNIEVLDKEAEDYVLANIKNSWGLHWIDGIVYTLIGHFMLYEFYQLSKRIGNIVSIHAICNLFLY